MSHQNIKSLPYSALKPSSKDSFIGAEIKIKIRFNHYFVNQFLVASRKIRKIRLSRISFINFCEIESDDGKIYQIIKFHKAFFTELSHKKLSGGKKLLTVENKIKTIFIYKKMKFS